MNMSGLSQFSCIKSFPDLEKIKGKIDALIFDLDGTLLDSMTLWNKVDIEFLSKRGYQVTPDYTDVVKRVSIDQAALYTKERFNLIESVQDIKDEWNNMVFEAYSNEIKVFDGVYDYIKKAHEMGFIIASATALSRINAEAALKSNRIYDYFSCLITLEDLGDNIDKSTPDIYLKVANMIKTPPERCIVYEDVKAAIDGAKLGKFNVTAVYDKIGAGAGSDWESMCNEADFVIYKWK